MKKATVQAWLFCILCLSQTPCLAIKPVPGVYAGVFLGPTYTPNIAYNFNPSAIPQSTIDSFESSLATFFNITVAEVQALFANTPLPNSNVPGTVKYSILGGIGGEVGYRMCSDYRFEAEIFYNNNPFSEITMGQYTIEGGSSDPNLHISGDTNTAALLFNFLYDIPLESKDGYKALRPYLGGGLGYAYIFSDLKFHYGENVSEQAAGAEPATLYEYNLRTARSAFVVQGIVGVSYSIDDFCWLSLDGRMLAAPIKSTTLLQKSNINFQSSVQLYSVMIGFHGVFKRA